MVVLRINCLFHCLIEAVLQNKIANLTCTLIAKQVIVDHF